MKKFVLLLGLVFVSFSCDPDNEKLVEFDLELVPVESVRLPDFFIEGETYEIEMEYKRPSVCHFLNAVYYSQQINEQQYEEGPAGPIQHNESVVTVSVENIVFKRGNCDAEIPKEEQITKAVLKLKIDQPRGTIYMFQFLKEKGQDGNPIYFVKEVVVITRSDYIS